MQRKHGEQYLLYKQHTAMFVPGGIGGRIVEAVFGWLPSPPIRSYVALILLLIVGVTGSFFARGASVKNLHYVVLPNTLLIFLEEPVGVSQSKIESEVASILADQPTGRGSVAVFYVLSQKDALHHLLIDSGIRPGAASRSKLPDASWYLVGASASYCTSET